MENQPAFVITWNLIIFSSLDPTSQMSYCHHLASVFICFQLKHLKLLGQLESNFAGMMFMKFSKDPLSETTSPNNLLVGTIKT
jgi:hypothetical protein